jgi:uncharacterized membrane protein
MVNSVKWLYSFLFLSIGINIFVIGYLLGNLPPAKNDIIANTVPMPKEMKGAFNTLSEENRKKVGELIQNQKQEMITNHDTIRQLRMQIAQVLIQEPLDQQKLASLFEKMSELSSRNIELAQQTIYQTLLFLPQSERIKVAKAMAAMSQKSAATLPGKSL